MTKDSLIEMHKETCAAALVTMKRKNQDYTAGAEDPFANFRMANFIGLKPEHGLLLRMMDKIKRAQSFTDLGSLAVKEESEDDVIEDIINYAILLKGLFRERREKNAEVQDWEKNSTRYATPIRSEEGEVGILRDGSETRRQTL